MEPADFPDPGTAPELFEGILTRRVVAYCIDLLICALISGFFILVVAITGVLTLGLAWLALPLAPIAAIILYYSATLGSPRRSTLGMRVTDIIVTPTRGYPLDGPKAFLHVLVFWVTIWVFWPLLFIGLFTQRRQLLHDFIVGTLVLRRSPMEAHWREYQGASEIPA